MTHVEYKAAIKILPAALKISSRTFFRYMYTRMNENYSMPVDDLARLSRFFNCRIEEMLNYEPPPLSAKRIKVKDKTDLVQKFKLVK